MSKINGFVGRRNFLKLVGIGSTLAATTIGAKSVLFPEAAVARKVANSQEKPQIISPDEGLQRLIDGNKRFVKGKPINPNQSPERLLETSATQFPYAAILGCSDSRVPTEVVFDQGVGDLFVVRVAGNVASGATIGSLEFSTAVLGSQLILVLGHESCGAVQAAIANEPLVGRLGVFVEEIKPAVEEVRSDSGDFEENAIIANVKFQIEELKQESTILNGLVEEGKLKIVGGFYDLDSGKVRILS